MSWQRSLRELRNAGGHVQQVPDTDMLTVNGEFAASFIVVRSRETGAGSLRWNIRFDAGLRPSVTVAVRLDRINHGALDYFLLPMSDMTAPRIRLIAINSITSMRRSPFSYLATND